MKVEHETQHLETNVSLRRMSVDANNPMLWQMLFSDLYSNKYRWVIEYAQNAADVDPNWRLVRPSVLNPYVKFIDKGPGMSHEFMMSLPPYDQGNGFCDAFYSTKSLSDEYVGGFGIGRISGPSGTLFEVSHGGFKRTYSMVRDDTKIPALLHTATEPTTETGVTVSVPVSPEEIVETNRQIDTLLRFFQPQLPEPEYIVKTPSWGLIKTNSYSSRHKLVVGGYPYDIDVSELAYDSPARTIFSSNVSHGENRFVVFVQVGQVSVTRSREHLKYTDKTKSTLDRIAEQIQTEIAATYQAEIDKCKTLWDARLKFSELVRHQNYVIQNILRDRLRFKGHTLHDRWININHPAFVYDCAKRSRNTIEPLPQTLTIDYRRGNGVTPSENVLVILDDLTTRRNIRARIAPLTTSKTVLVMVKDKETIRDMGDPPYHVLSALPLPPKAPGTRSTRSYQPPNLKVWSDGSWLPTTQTFPSGTVYVPLNGFDPEIKNFQVLAKSPLAPHTIVGVHRSTRGKVPDDWVRLDDHVKGQMTPQLRDEVAVYKACRDHLDRVVTENMAILHLALRLPNTELAALQDELRILNRKKDDYKEKLIPLFEKLPKRKPLPEYLAFEKSINRLKRKYKYLDAIASIVDGYYINPNKLEKLAQLF